MDVKDSEALATKRKGALWASERAGRRLQKVGVLAALSTGAIMTQPHLALGLPGHRALMWLALLFIMRLVGGPGWATAVGLAPAGGTLAIGRAPARRLLGAGAGLIAYGLVRGLSAMAAHRRRRPGEGLAPAGSRP